MTAKLKAHASLEVEESGKNIPQPVKLINIDDHSLICNQKILNHLKLFDDDTGKFISSMQQFFADIIANNHIKIRIDPKGHEGVRIRATLIISDSNMEMFNRKSVEEV